MSHDDNPRNPKRRDVIRLAVAAAGGIAMPAIWTQSKAATTRLVLRDSGGIYNTVYSEVFYKPFQQATGIEVVGVTSNAEPTAQIRTIVETNAHTWDMAEISQPAVFFLTNGTPYLEPHGLGANPVIASIPAQYSSPYCVGQSVYSTVLAYRTDAFKGRAAPASWQDFWDTAKFPGRRALRRFPFDTIEESLMADGVPTSGVYPCNLDRAFASLSKVKPNVNVWWTGGAQSETLLKTGEVAMASVWLTRAQAAIDAGAPIAISWNQHVWGVQGFGILKGTENLDACRKFITFCADPKRQAEMSSRIAIGATQPAAYQYIDAKRASLLPTQADNIKRGVRIDPSYWPKNQDAAIERFNDWILT